jgi:thiamine biosynthesis lipoprotein
MSKTSTKPLQRFALNGPAMGSRWTALLYAREAVDTAPLQAALRAVVETVETQMSTWRPESDLMRLNAAPVGASVEVPGGLMMVLEKSLEIGRASGGAFDIGVGDLVGAWGFGAQAGRVDLDAAKVTRTPAIAALELDPTRWRVRKTAHVALDLSGIAKGFGVDQMGAVLDCFGITAWLVGIDGEMRAKGGKPDGTAWTVALEEPEPGVRKVRGVIALNDQAVATSGDYRHFVEQDGTRTAHTMHPVQGGPVRNRVTSVTVVAETCMEADAWATALLVLGEVTGPLIARAKGLSALFILRDRDGYSEVGVGPAFEG